MRNKEKEVVIKVRRNATKILLLLFKITLLILFA